MAAPTSGAWKIMIRNLLWTANRDVLKDYFTKFGRVRDARVIFDKDTGLSRKFGFVELTSKDVYDNVLSQNSHFIEGQEVEVIPSQVIAKSKSSKFEIDANTDHNTLGKE